MNKKKASLCLLGLTYEHLFSREIPLFYTMSKLSDFPTYHLQTKKETLDGARISSFKS